MAKLLNSVGWVLGILLSLILPTLTAPLNLKLPFSLGGAFSGMVGFGLMHSVLKDRTVSNRTKRALAAVALVVGIAAAAFYRSLLFDPEHGTPTTLIMWLEFTLFCMAFCGLFAVLAFVYWNGGKFFLQKFGKFSVPEL